MPLYEYQCESCQKVTERIQKFSDPPIESCPSCGGPVRKLPSSPAIQFKGSGWYVTDYARKSSNGSGPSTESDRPDTTSGKQDAGGKPEKAESTPSTPAKSDSK